MIRDSSESDFDILRLVESGSYSPDRSEVFGFITDGTRDDLTTAATVYCMAADRDWKSKRLVRGPYIY